MRPYRGKTKNGKCGWVYGWYIEYNFGGTIDEPKMHYYIVENWRDHSQLSGRLTEVIPKTVGQQVGKQDKDGVEIYAGDIVEFNVVNMIWDEEKHEVKEHRHETRRRVVEYKAPEFWLHWYPEKMKVIGNVTDDSELLNSKKLKKENVA